MSGRSSQTMVEARIASDRKNQLFKILDDAILRKELTELHTHLMGMGSADFWVSKIMESYLPRIELDKPLEGKVKFSLAEAMTASGFSHSNNSEFSIFEALFFDGFLDRNLKSEAPGSQISNATIVSMLHEEDERTGRGGPFRALVRNWFQFLGSNGQSAMHTEVLRTFRGQFSPEFYPQRFIMKDPIVKAHPEVLGILLNSTCARYAKAGVHYIEYSVSCGDLLNKEKFTAMRNKTFCSPLFAPGRKQYKQEERAYEPKKSPPMLPDLLKMDPPSLSWRKYVDYKEKVKGQTIVFLAAFTRDKPDQPGSGKPGTVYCTLKAGAWIRSDQQPKTHREAYLLLGEIASNKSEIAQFLGDTFPSPTLANSAANFPILRALAKKLCHDDNLDKVYNYLLTEKAAITQLGQRLLEKDGLEITPLMARAVVGLDWVGDELGHPFCPFSHAKFVDVVLQYMKHNNKFGVRFHAGEGPIRPSTFDAPTSQVRLAFYLHMYIITEGIRLYHRKMTYFLNKGTSLWDESWDESWDEAMADAAPIQPNIRIGHGVAFLWGLNDSNEGSKDAFFHDMQAFRNFLSRHTIVCELNPTSNHMLLPSTFQGSGANNVRTLPTFLGAGLPVVLATDDDGIWAIHKCKRHYHHVSVAAEYCEAISNGDIKDPDHLQKMLGWGRTSSFSQPFTSLNNSLSTATPASDKKRKHGQFSSSGGTSSSIMNCTAWRDVAPHHCDFNEGKESTAGEETDTTSG